MTIPELTRLAKEYDPLLSSYAYLLVQDKSVADTICHQVLEEYYDAGVMLEGKVLRGHLYSHTFMMCMLWKDKQRPV